MDNYELETRYGNILSGNCSGVSSERVSLRLHLGVGKNKFMVNCRKQIGSILDA